jgi:predicted DCC family thiol-disulfide oxidoreductase YuxK
MTADPRAKNSAPPRAAVLYDGDCAFCRRSVALLHKLDWRHRLEPVNVRADAPLLHRPPVAGAPLLEQMHVLTADGRHLYGGYRAIRWLAWRLPLTWLVAPFLYLPGMTWLGQRAYLWVARHRFDIVPCQHGACEIKRNQTR